LQILTSFGRNEAEEIQDLYKVVKDLNLACIFLSGAINFDPVVTVVDAKMASQIVWLDAYITNVDRTFRNTNMLLWHKELWLIDHVQVSIFTILDKLGTTRESV
jgi:hypothetical protein